MRIPRIAQISVNQVDVQVVRYPPELQYISTRQYPITYQCLMSL